MEADLIFPRGGGIGCHVDHVSRHVRNGICQIGVRAVIPTCKRELFLRRGVPYGIGRDREFIARLVIIVLLLCL